MKKDNFCASTEIFKGMNFFGHLLKTAVVFARIARQIARNIAKCIPIMQQQRNKFGRC